MKETKRYKNKNFLPLKNLNYKKVPRLACSDKRYSAMDGSSKYHFRGL